MPNWRKKQQKIEKTEVVSTCYCVPNWRRKQQRIVKMEVSNLLLCAARKKEAKYGE